MIRAASPTISGMAKTLEVIRTAAGHSFDVGYTESFGKGGEDESPGLIVQFDSRLLRNVAGANDPVGDTQTCGRSADFFVIPAFSGQHQPKSAAAFIFEKMFEAAQDRPGIFPFREHAEVKDEVPSCSVFLLHSRIWVF